MGRIQDLARIYKRHIAAPWQRTVTGAQRVILAIYDKELEKKLRGQIEEFEQATKQANHPWQLIDASSWFSEWMAKVDYRESFFEDPALLEMSLDTEFREYCCERLRSAFTAVDSDTVTGLLGIGSLFGFARASDLIRAIEPDIQGRLLIFFPGTKDGNNYRLLDARDGWNYLAVSLSLNEAGKLQ